MIINENEGCREKAKQILKDQHFDDHHFLTTYSTFPIPILSKHIVNPYRLIIK